MVKQNEDSGSTTTDSISNSTSNIATTFLNNIGSTLSTSTSNPNSNLKNGDSDQTSSSPSLFISNYILLFVPLIYCLLV